MALSSKHVEDLFVSLLSINNYAVTKTWDLLPQLREAGLTDPKRVAGLDGGVLSRELKSAGYDRGKITDIIAPRLRNLMALIEEGDLDSLPDLVARGDKDGVQASLVAIEGVGPRVAATAWMLLSSPADDG